MRGCEEAAVGKHGDGDAGDRHRTEQQVEQDQLEADGVERVGASARVLVDEPTATKSIYVMRADGGVWRIDDIVEAR